MVTGVVFVADSLTSTQLGHGTHLRTRKHVSSPAERMASISHGLARTHHRRQGRGADPANPPSAGSSPTPAPSTCRKTRWLPHQAGIGQGRGELRGGNLRGVRAPRDRHPGPDRDDNPTRTVGNVRNVVNKNGGNFAATGSVSFHVPPDGVFRLEPAGIDQAIGTY